MKQYLCSILDKKTGMILFDLEVEATDQQMAKMEALTIYRKQHTDTNHNLVAEAIEL